MANPEMTYLYALAALSVSFVLDPVRVDTRSEEDRPARVPQVVEAKWSRARQG